MSVPRLTFPDDCDYQEFTRLVSDWLNHDLAGDGLIVAVHRDDVVSLGPDYTTLANWSVEPVYRADFAPGRGDAVAMLVLNDTTRIDLHRLHPGPGAALLDTMVVDGDLNEAFRELRALTPGRTALYTALRAANPTTRHGLSETGEADMDVRWCALPVSDQIVALVDASTRRRGTDVWRADDRSLAELTGLVDAWVAAGTTGFDLDDLFTVHAAV